MSSDNVKASVSEALAKVPEVTLGFWLIKILATTLGETGGDAVSMSMNLGYLVSTLIFAAFFAFAVCAQILRIDSVPCCTGPRSSRVPGRPCTQPLHRVVGVARGNGGADLLVAETCGT